MPLSEGEYCEKVRRLAAQRGQTLQLADIQESLENALSALAEEVWRTGEYPLLEVEFTEELVAGVCDLSARTDIFIDSIETVKHPDFAGDGVPVYFSRLPNGSRADLTHSRSQLYPPYVIEKTALYLSKGGGTWPDPGDFPPDDTLTITAQKIPLLSDVPVSLEDLLIEKGLAVASGAMTSE